MSRRFSMRIFLLIAMLINLLAVADAQQAQNQTASQPQNQQPAQQTQPAPQPQKKNFWQKVKQYSQAEQNAVGQGTNTAQQGSGTIQQSGQQIQNGVQQIQNGAQQGTSGAQQGTVNGFQSTGSSGSCGPSCFDAGPFQANVSQMTLSQEGAWHVIRMNIQFHNSTNQPLSIAYHDGSMVMVDNNGNTYIPAGGNPGELQGMGIDRGAQTDSQFQLGPGQTGSALFSVARNRPANSPIGTGYSYNFTIDELQLQNGALAIPVRTYNLNFPTLAPGTSNAPFASGSSSANSFAANGNRTNSVSTVTSQGSVAAQQQRMINGKPITTTPGKPAASVVNNAAMRSPVTTSTHPQTAASAKPNPAVAAKPATATTAPKKTTSTTTTTTTK